MVFGTATPSLRRTLSSQQALELANMYLQNSYRATDPVIVLVLCHEVEVSLLQAKKAAKHEKNQTAMDEIATAYIDLANQLKKHGHDAEANAIRRKGEKVG